MSASAEGGGRVGGRVRAVVCDHRAGNEEVYQALRRACLPLEGSWERLRRARTIAVKVNQDFVPERVIRFEGQPRALVSSPVARAVLRLLKEETSAEVFVVDAGFARMYHERSVEETTTIAPVLRELGIRYVDGTVPPFARVNVPGGGSMFGSYVIPEEVAEADAVVSVAKMKNHRFMGITGAVKNLFGLMPGEPLGRPRTYYHHLVRMPYMLTDLVRTLDPALSVVDGLVGQAGAEWAMEPDRGRIVGALLAGENAVSTDACMATLMGHDPEADWPSGPFLRDRNTLQVAAGRGYGAVLSESIDFQSEAEPQPSGTFFCERSDDEEMVFSWRRSMCEQALVYRESLPLLARAYEGQYILLQQGRVVWSSPKGSISESRRRLAGGRTDQSLFYKYVDSAETEAERFEVYERELARL